MPRPWELVSPHEANVPDPYFGYKDIATICSRYMAHVFECQDNGDESLERPLDAGRSLPSLTRFIAFALYHANQPSEVLFMALFFLQRYQARVPETCETGGRRLFICAYMIASKYICDHTYPNADWFEVAQGLFSLQYLCREERRMFAMMNHHLKMEHQQLRDFEAWVRREFSRPRPRPDLMPRKPLRNGPALSSGVPFTPLISAAPPDVMEMSHWLDNDGRS